MKKVIRKTKKRANTVFVHEREEEMTRKEFWALLFMAWLTLMCGIAGFICLCSSWSFFACLGFAIFYFTLIEVIVFGSFFGLYFLLRGIGIIFTKIKQLGKNKKFQKK